MVWNEDDVKSLALANTTHTSLIQLTRQQKTIPDKFALLFTKEKCPSCVKIKRDVPRIEEHYKNKAFMFVNMKCDVESVIKFFLTFSSHNVPSTVPRIILIENGIVSHIHPTEVVM